MNRKLQIILMLNMIAFTLLFSNISSGNAATREWNAGEIFIWSEQYIVETEKINSKEGVSSYNKMEFDTEIKYNLTAIDTIDKEYDAYVSDTTTTLLRENLNYGADEFVEDNLPLDTSMNVEFDWNYETNQTVLYEFGFYIEPFVLIESDWAEINTGFAELFNLSEIVDTVSDPYEPILYNYTLSDVFGNSSMINIQGVKNNLNKSITKFTDTTTKFSIKFDFTGKIYDQTYNSTAGYDNNYLFDIYTTSLEFSYSEGGVLQKAVYKVDTQSTYDDLITHVTITSTMILGSLKSLTGNFALLAIIPAIGLIAVIARVKRNK